VLEAWISSLFRMAQVGLGIGFVIFVHELGHFLVAKKVGVRVDVFSLGFGPRLFGFRRGVTDYRISAIPLGGYVSMAGEGSEEGSGGADDFSAKSVGARSAVIVAGVVMNAIFAVLMFLLAFKVGVRMDEPAIGRVQPGKVAAEAGLRFGDRVISVNGEPTLEFMDLSLAAAYADGPLAIVVDRQGERVSVTCTPRRQDGPIQQLGVERMYAVHKVREGSPAAKAGLRDGDWIVAIYGRPVSEFEDVLEAIRDAPERTLTFTVRRASGAFEAVPFTPGKREARTYGASVAPFPIVQRVSPDSAAEAAGLKPGDVILEIDGGAAHATSFADRIARTAAGTAVALTLVRGDSGERLPITVTPRADPKSPGAPPRLGILLGTGLLGDVAPGSPAAQAGLLPGDRIVGFGKKAAPDGVKIDLLERAANEPEAVREPLVLDVKRRGVEAPIRVSLLPVTATGRFEGESGFGFATAGFVHSVPGIVEPVRLGFNRTVLFMEQVFLTFQGMFANRIDPSMLGGPIGIASTAYQVTDQGFGKLLYFLAIISVNLAVLNILPIPILDGGHLVFLAVEKLKGGPVAPAIHNAAQWVGLAMLLALMVYATKNDIVNVILGG